MEREQGVSIVDYIYESTVMVDPVNACSLLGSFETCLSTQDIFPLIHGTAGCPCVMWLTMVSNPTYLGFSQLKFPTTGLKQSEIIYGGERKLEENIEKAIKVYRPKMILIISSCTPSIIGDDIDFVARKMRERYQIPIVAVDTRSSRWDYMEGRVSTQITLIRDIMEKGRGRKEKAVNIFGLYPGDYNWRGDLKELKRMLTGIGVEVNSVIPVVEDLEELKRAPEASLNLVVSSESGLAPAREMEKLFGVPYLDLVPPYGLNGTERWLRAITQALDLNRGMVEEFIEKEAKETADTIVPHFTSFGQVRLLRGIPTALLGDASRLAGIIGFIVRELGMKPVVVGLKSATENSLQQIKEIKEELGVDFKLLEHLRSMEDIVTTFQTTKIDFLFGSDIENKLAARAIKSGAFVGIASPNFFKYNITNRPYMGYRGAVYLFEEIMNGRMVMYQSHRPYGSFWDLLE